jgi:hypothetical protein
VFGEGGSERAAAPLRGCGSVFYTLRYWRLRAVCCSYCNHYSVSQCSCQLQAGFVAIIGNGDSCLPGLFSGPRSAPSTRYWNMNMSELEAIHLPYFSAEVKYVCGCCSTEPYAIRAWRCKHRGHLLRCGARLPLFAVVIPTLAEDWRRVSEGECFALRRRSYRRMEHTA